MDRSFVAKARLRLIAFSYTQGAVSELDHEYLLFCLTAVASVPSADRPNRCAFASEHLQYGGFADAQFLSHDPTRLASLIATDNLGPKLWCHPSPSPRLC